MNNTFNFNRNLGTKIYTNKLGYKVYIKFVVDVTSKRQSYILHIVDPDGGVSERIVLKRSALQTNKSCLNRLMDYEGDFEKEDIVAIYMKIQLKTQEMQKKAVKVSEKIPFDVVYKLICDYIRENALDESCEEIFIERNLGYIETTYLKKMMSALDLYDYTRKELLSTLADYGLLVCSPNRSYDYFKKREGKLKHFCCVKLLDTNIYAVDELEVA